VDLEPRRTWVQQVWVAVVHISVAIAVVFNKLNLRVALLIRTCYNYSTYSTDTLFSNIFLSRARSAQ
jgi:hypothetical protein